MPDCAPLILGKVNGDDDEKWDSPRRRWKAKCHFGDQGSDQDQALADHRQRRAAGDHANVRTFVSDQWTFEYDLAFSGLAEEVFIAMELASQDEAINAGKKDRDAVVAEARSDYQRLVADCGDSERLCSTIYSGFGSDTSKAVAAQYLAELLEERLMSDGTPEAGPMLAKQLPDYIVAAIRWATRSGDPAEAPPAGNV